MTLTLAVETSSFTYDVALLAPDGDLAARRTVQLRDPAFLSVGYLVEAMMTEAGRTFGELGRLAVDTGPGNVISVRAGISYVNGLAFSRNLPVLGVDSLTLLAARTAATGHVLALRNAGAGTVNAALHHDGRRVAGRHGRLETVAAELLDGIDEVTVAGTFRERVAPAVPGCRVTDSGIEFPDVVTLGAVVHAGGGTEGLFATPITDATTNSTSVHPS